MRKAMTILGSFGLLFLLGAGFPGSSDRDLIVRLQGEVLVLQRQVRDLQETIDKNHATSSQVATRVAESSEASGKILFSLQDRLNQTDTLQHNNLAGVVKRLSQLEESSNQSGTQLTEISRSLKEIKAAIQRPVAPKPEN